MAGAPEHATEDAQEGPGARRAGRIGRRAALALYWTLLLYLAVVGFTSVIPQVFFPEVDETARAELPQDCAAAIAVQHEALEEFAMAVTGRDTNNPEFWQSWDRRHNALGTDCGGDERFGRLETLRYHFENSLQRLEREEGAESDALASSLAAARDTND